MPSCSRFTRLTAATALVGLLAAGCAGERPTIDESGASREVAVDAQNPTTTSSAPSEPITIRLAVGGDWSGDPADATPTAVANRVIAGLLHEGLTAIDANGQVVAGLADRWFISDDRLQWTFVLPENLTDNLGQPLEARDVKASLERLAERGAADQAVVALGPIEGWDTFVAGNSGGVAGISAVDEVTLVISLDTPFEPLGAVLADPAYGVTGEAEDGATRTTGDYRYGDAATLVAVDPDSSVPQISLVPATGNGGALLAAGAVDWAVLSARDVSETVPGDVIRQPLELQTGIVVRLADPEVRGAILAALNGTELALELANVSVAITPGVDGDPAALPERLTIHVPTGALAALGAEIETQLTEVGVEVEIVELEPAAFADAVLDGTAVVFPMVSTGTGFIRSSGLSATLPGGPDDVLGVDDEARRTLVAALWAEPDPGQRSLLITAAEERLREQRLWLPVANAEVRIGLSAAMSPLRILADGTLDLSGF